MSALPEPRDRTLVVFRCGPVWLSAVVDAVEAVIPAPETLTPVPHAAPCTLGIFEHRGETATVVDVACKLGLADARADRPGRAILVRGGAGLLAFLVDDLLDVAQAARFQWAEAPASVPGELFTATLSRDGHLILHTDFETLYRFPGPAALDAWVARLPPAQTAVEVGGAGTEPELVPFPEAEKDESPAMDSAGSGSEASEGPGRAPVRTEAAQPPETGSRAEADLRPAAPEPPASTAQTATPVEDGPTTDPPPPREETAQLSQGEEAPPEGASEPQRRPQWVTAKKAVTPRRAAEPPRLEDSLGRPRPGPGPAETVREAPPTRRDGPLPLPELEAVLSRLERLNAPIQPEPPPPPADDDPSWLVRPEPRPVRIVHRRPGTRRRRRPWPPRIAALLAVLVVTLNFPLIADLERQRAAQRGTPVLSAPTLAPAPPPSGSSEPAAPLPSVDWTLSAENASGGLSDAPYLPWSVPVQGPPPPFDPRRLRVHVVDRGETLWRLAERYLDDPWRYRELARLSNIRDPDLILPGEYIYYLRRD